MCTVFKNRVLLSSSDFSLILEGYLGDPRRNIRLSNFHLEAAKNKPTPSCATCYLANLILSEEILLNTVADQISHCIFTDHNKMSAIRGL